MENNSTNDDLITVIVVNGSNEVLAAQTMTTGSGTYVFNLMAATNWTGDEAAVRIRFTSSSKAGTANEGRSSGTGDIIVDDIVFELDPSLSSTGFDTATFSVYPNPAKNLVNINSVSTISKVELFSITGKRVMEVSNIRNNQINISQLKTGMYLMRLSDVNNNSATKKLIIK